jgi:hypothetical protein
MFLRPKESLMPLKVGDFSVIFLLLTIRCQCGTGLPVFWASETCLSTLAASGLLSELGDSSAVGCGRPDHNQQH